jgi:hypothetical protein
MTAGPRYIAPAQTAQKTPLPTVTPLCVTQPLHSSGCFSGSTVLTLGKYATLCARKDSQHHTSDGTHKLQPTDA